MAHPFRRVDLLLLVSLSVLWGTAFAFINMGLLRFSPILFAAFRFDLAGVCLLTIALIHAPRDFVPTRRHEWAAILVAGGLMTGAYHAFLFWGQRDTTASVAAVIVGLSPVLTTIFSRLLLHDERVGVHGLVGLGLGFLGIFLLAAFKPGSKFDAQGIGELAIVVAIASWALGSAIVKRLKHGMGIYKFAGWQTIVGAFLLHLSSLALERNPRFEVDRAGLWALLYLSLVSSGIGFTIYFGLLERVGPIRVNLVSYLAPIFATIAGIWILGHPFEWRALIAFAFIVTGFVLVARPRKPSSKVEDAGGVAPQDLVKDPVLPGDLADGR
ncbi:MAG TPA: DMT family transporter [Candidatus Thermoplasmatota archaeon]|nr:DMT family transporter [Candidatus Thermoplasmatota archaeon]